MFMVHSPECEVGVSNGEGRAWFNYSELSRKKGTEHNGASYVSLNDTPVVAPA